MTNNLGRLYATALAVVIFFVAWAVIAVFMNYVRNKSFLPFAVYRILLAIIVLI